MKIILIVMTAMLMSYSEKTAEALSLPTDNLQMPVLIKSDSYPLASGFYFRKNKDVYLVTAKHVLFNEKTHVLRTTQTIILSSFSPNQKNVSVIVKLQLGDLFSKGFIKSHLTADMAMIKLMNNGEGVTSDVQFQSSNPLGTVAEYALKPSSEVYVSADVFVFGYPSSIGLANISQIEYDKPLIRKGNIAGRNEKTGTIIIACPVYKGNSGGPVVEVESINAEKQGFRVIGVISQYIPYQDRVYESKQSSFAETNSMVLGNTGYAVVTPIDGIYDLLKMF